MRVQAIGSEVAADTSRSAEMKAPAKSVAVSRAVVREANIGKTPFSIWSRTRPSGPCPYHCKGCANLKKSLVFNERGETSVESASGARRRLGIFTTALGLARRRVAAVGVEHLAGHVGGVVACQEQEARGHFVGLAG